MMKQKINFIAKEEGHESLEKTNILLHDTSQPDLHKPSGVGELILGYIDQNHNFFPNNNMMFKTAWLFEIANYMQTLIGNPRKDCLEKLTVQYIIRLYEKV